MESLSKHCEPRLIFFIRSGCLLVMHLYALCKTLSVVDHGVECYDWSIFF